MTRTSAKPPSVDELFARLNPFARPIGDRLRKLIRGAAPHLRETIKWHLACFEGRKLVCGIGAFQAHVSLVFFRGAELPDPDSLLQHGRGNAAMRSVKVTSLAGIPAGGIQALVKAAAALDQDVHAKPPPRARRPEVLPPDALTEALAREPKARAHLHGLPPSCQREYYLWVLEAKRPETVRRRVAAAVERLKAGRRMGETRR